MTIDVEHFAKMELLSWMEGHSEDGYELVHSFLEAKTHINPRESLSVAFLTRSIVEVLTSIRIK